MATQYISKQGFSMAQHAEFGRRIQQVMADISALTDMVFTAYPTESNSFNNHMTRQFDKARAKLEIARTTAEDRMMRDYPHSYDVTCYRGGGKP